MKTRKKGFRGLKLNRKFTLVVFTLTFIPFALLAAVLFVNMQNEVIDDRLGDTQGELMQIQTRAERTVELCAMTAQFFLSSPRMHNFLLRAGEGESFTTEELIAFYQEDVVGQFEKMVNANPYLYQVRVFFANADVPEFYPILYHSSRMERLSWASKGWTSGTWQYDYTDTLFAGEVMRPTEHIMSLVTEITDYKSDRIGVMEVAVRMNEMFPEIFSDRGSSLHVFAAGPERFIPPGQEPFWNAYGAEIDSAVQEQAPDGGASVEVSIGGRSAFVSSVPVKPFGGAYSIVQFRDEITAGISARRNVFVATAALSLLLLAFIVNLLVKTMLRRFYKVIEAIHAVRGGTLSAEVPYAGDDEIGLLGEQLNQMLDRIRILMDANVRALHSQINAHFIYNVLETIKMMAEVDEHYEVSDAITSLGKLLRYSMRWTPDNVSLEEELEHLENYIRLLNLRYDYHIRVEKDIPPSLCRQKIPKLTLQPIVENAVIHGLEEIAEDATIYLDASEYDSYFTVKITDKGKGMTEAALARVQMQLTGEVKEESDAGIGLKNVHDRIVMAFGEGYGIRIDSKEDWYTSVTIRLPYGHEY